MKQIVLFACLGAGIAALFHGSVSDPASWALVLAGVAGGGLVGARGKRPIGIDG